MLGQGATILINSVDRNDLRSRRAQRLVLRIPPAVSNLTAPLAGSNFRLGASNDDISSAAVSPILASIETSGG